MLSTETRPDILYTIFFKKTFASVLIWYPPRLTLRGQSEGSPSRRCGSLIELDECERETGCVDSKIYQRMQTQCHSGRNFIEVEIKSVSHRSGQQSSIERAGCTFQESNAGKRNNFSKLELTMFNTLYQLTCSHIFSYFGIPK